jgi:thioredoxin-related protein
MDVVKKFNVTGAPTTLVLASDGKELHRFAGYMPPADYLKELKKAA